MHRLRQALAAQLQQAKIVPLDVETIADENPWLKLGDRLKDNPLLDEVAESITQYRRELDAEDEVA